MITYCQKHNLKLVVITHYPPSYSVSPHNTDYYSSLYFNNLDHLLTSSKIHTWIFWSHSL